MAEQSWLNVYRDIPPITKLVTTSTILITLACNVEFVSQFQLYLNPYLIVQRFQVWRLITCFLYAGPFDLGTAFNLLFSYRYARILEDNCFHGRAADFCFMLVFVWSIIIFLAFPLTDMLFLGNSLSHCFLYVWCRRHPEHRVMIFGVFILRAEQVHFVLILLSLMTGTSLTSDLLALIAGHMYYFLEDVFPLQPLGFKVLQTPRFLKALFNELDDEDVPSDNSSPVAVEHAPQIQDENNNMVENGALAQPQNALPGAHQVADHLLH